jgi:hypothetical protein
MIRKCNRFYQRAARQQFCKHGPTRNNTLSGPNQQNWPLCLKRCLKIKIRSMNVEKFVVLLLYLHHELLDFIVLLWSSFCILSRNVTRNNLQWKFSKFKIYMDYLTCLCIVSLPIYVSTALMDFGWSFSFLILYTAGRSPWKGDQEVARPLPTHRTAQTLNKSTQYRHPCFE